jgi:hypothetical protein
MDSGYQRMLDMAKRAGLKAKSETHLSPAELAFAESLIIECAGIAHNNIDDQEDATRVPQLIFDFFGVK